MHEDICVDDILIKNLWLLKKLVAFTVRWVAIDYDELTLFPQ